MKISESGVAALRRNAFISYRIENLMSTTTQVSSESRSQYKAKAYSAASAESPLAPTMIPRRDPGERDVQIGSTKCVWNPPHRPSAWKMSTFGRPHRSQVGDS